MTDTLTLLVLAVVGGMYKGETSEQKSEIVPETVQRYEIFVILPKYD